MDTEVAGKIDEFISKLKGLKEVESAFTFVSYLGMLRAASTCRHCLSRQKSDFGGTSFPLQILDDPSGNSFVENPHAPQKDDALEVTHYRRTAQQAALLGIEVTGRAWKGLAWVQPQAIPVTSELCCKP